MAAPELTHQAPVGGYAKAIYSLSREGEGPVSTSALAERLAVTAGSVSAVVRELDALGVAEHTPYIAPKLGNPTHDDHGDPIPSADFSIEELDTRPFDELAVGEAGVFARVSDSDLDMLRCLAERSIRPGERFEVLDRRPFGGPLTVRLESGAEHVLGGELARAMRVEPQR